MASKRAAVGDSGGRGSQSAGGPGGPATILGLSDEQLLHIFRALNFQEC